jgi:uncharacterized protein (TIGR02271 family)
LRDVPILTFVNQLDREGRDPFDLLDEIEQALALDVTSASWPIGMGRDFLGTYDLLADALLLFERGLHDRITEPVRCSGLDDAKLPRLLPKEALAKLREEVEMAKGLCPPFDQEAYREGHLTPVYFGSALNNFGVPELLAGVGELPQRRGRSRPLAPMRGARSRRGMDCRIWTEPSLIILCLPSNWIEGDVLTADEVQTAAIPVFEESFRVDKTVRDADRVLIKTSVQERTEYAELELRSGEATIERFPVNRVVDAAPAIRQEGDTIIVPVIEEIMVVEKRLLLKEEIHIRRQEVVQHVREPVRLRSEDVSLERSSPTNPSNREDET